MKVIRRASDLPFHTCQDALSSMKKDSPDTGQQGSVCSVWRQRFELQKKPPGCEGERFTFTSPHWPPTWLQQHIWANTWERLSGEIKDIKKTCPLHKCANYPELMNPRGSDDPQWSRWRYRCPVGNRCPYMQNCSVSSYRSLKSCHLLASQISLSPPQFTPLFTTNV